MPLSAEYSAMFEQLAAQEPAPPLWEMTAQQGREMYRAMRPINPELPIHQVEDRVIQGQQGDIPIRIYYPGGNGPFGMLMNFHGGGWVIGDLDTSDAVCRELSHLAQVIVISVDYRMAPESPYPAAVIDAYDATVWASEHTSELGGNGKLGVTGESAGGNLSAVVAQKARDENGPAIAFQCLLYPVTDCDLSRPSYAENGEGYLLETKSMAFFWDTYCPNPTQRREAYASPMLADNLADLPPALIVTAEFDPLRDEGEAYAAALSDAGNEAKAVRYDGVVHDFLATAAIFQCSRTAMMDVVEALQAHLNS